MAESILTMKIGNNVRQPFQPLVYQQQMTVQFYKWSNSVASLIFRLVVLKAADYMKEVILAYKAGGRTGQDPNSPLANLDSKCYKDFSNPTRKIMGIGHIPTLNSEVPYWYFLNYGISQKGMIIPGWGKVTVGSFNGNAPDSLMRGTRVGKEVWKAQRGGQFAMRATSPIEPIYYNEKTAQYIGTLIPTIANIIKASKVTMEPINSFENVGENI